MEEPMEKLYELMRAYKDRFGDTFPTISLGYSVEEICEIIQDCLDKDKPTDIYDYLQPGDLI